MNILLAFLLTSSFDVTVAYVDTSGEFVWTFVGEIVWERNAEDTTLYDVWVQGKKVVGRVNVTHMRKKSYTLPAERIYRAVKKYPGILNCPTKYMFLYGRKDTSWAATDSFKIIPNPKWKPAGP